MEKKTRFSRFLIAIAVILITLGGIKLVEAVSMPTYDKARIRTARLSDDHTNIEHTAMKLFQFNTDQIHSDQLDFRESVALEYARNYNDGFYNPIKLFMEYQGGDRDGKTDAAHSLVFEDGSSVTAAIEHNTLHLCYYSGWQMRGKFIMLSGVIRELYFLPDSTRIWNNDGHICAFSAKNGAWFFRESTAYFCSDDSAIRVVDLPFNFNQMRSWCALDTGVYTFTIYDGLGYILWEFNNGDCTQIYASPAQDDGSTPDVFRASNFTSANVEQQIVYDLPEGRVIIDAEGDIIQVE